MAMPIPMSEFLSSSHVDYHILKHKPTPGWLETAQSASIPLSDLARSLLLESKTRPGQLLMAVIPASYGLDLEKLAEFTGEAYQLVEPGQLTAIFQDCQPEEIPGLGQPYDLEMILDQRLLRVEQIYLQDGDNTELIKLQRHQFIRLMADVPHADLCLIPPSSSDEKRAI